MMTEAEAISNAQRKELIEEMVAWAHINLPTLVKYTVVGFLADYMHQTVELDDDKQAEPETVAERELPTVDDCDDMLGQINSMERFHNGMTSITMTTKEARAFVNSAKDAAFIKELHDRPYFDRA